jgi:hypothetical protein
MGNFGLGDTAICFGKLSHEDKNRFEENGLPMCASEWINGASPVRNVAVYKASGDIPKHSAENAEEVKAY